MRRAPSRRGESSSFSCESSSVGRRREVSKGRRIELPNSSSREAREGDHFSFPFFNTGESPRRNTKG